VDFKTALYVDSNQLCLETPVDIKCPPSQKLTAKYGLLLLVDVVKGLS
jgi:hypothetical protein